MLKKVSSNNTYITKPTCLHLLGSSPPSIPLIADSGSTGHYLSLESQHITNLQPTSVPITVNLPDNSTMTSTHTADLIFNNLPAEAIKADIFPALLSHSLLSIGTLCDAGCTANFTSTKVVIKHDNKIVLTGHRNTTNKLWTIDDVPPTDSFACATINQTTKPAELVAFAHAALFSPALSTLQKALNKNYISNFPGLTAASLKLHPPQSVATIKGHLDQVRKNIRSTSKNPTDLPLLPLDLDTDDTLTDHFPESDPDNAETNFCYATIIPSTKTGQIFTDQTGRFILPASTGNTQLFVLYDYDSNSIHVEPMQSKSAKAILMAFKLVYNRLVKAGLKPKLQRLDNECSTILKDYLTEEKINFQLVPPGVH